MELLNITKISKKKTQLAGKYLLAGVKYIVTPLKRDRIALEVHNPNGKCYFGGCRVERSIGFLRKNNMNKV